MGRHSRRSSRFHLLVIGGSDAGISAALRAREIDTGARITVAVADRFPNYSICGLPFLLSGEVKEWSELAHRTTEEIEREGIELLLGQKADLIDTSRHEVTLIDQSGEKRPFGYDGLVIATGAVSARPPVRDLGLPGVFFLRWMGDGLEVARWIADRRPRRALVVGGGYIGVEMADALTRRDIRVSIMELYPNVLQSVDADLGEQVRAELVGQGVEVLTGTALKSISCEAGGLLVTGGADFTRAFDMIIVATGALPETALVRAAGISLGVKGAITVDRRMATGAADVFAAGDCAETYHRILGRNSYMPLGTVAHKQGRIAGENAAGGNIEFAGTLGTQVVKVFGLVAARTGLRQEESTAAGFDPLSVDSESWDHKAYYPGATRIKIRMTGDRRTGRLLGAQVLGQHGAEVSKRVDLLAAALFHEMKVEELLDLDLSYTPPLSSPWDPVQMSAQSWLQELGRTR